VIGLEVPNPGKAVFQTMFFSASQVTGKRVSSDTPLAAGPRKRVQSAPLTSDADKAHSAAAQQTRIDLMVVPFRYE
jgi:hypothetical protein